MDTLQQQVGCDQYLFVGIVQNGRIIAHSFDGTAVLQLDLFRQMADQSKLTQGGNFCSVAHKIIGYVVE